MGVGKAGRLQAEARAWEVQEGQWRASSLGPIGLGLNPGPTHYRLEATDKLLDLSEPCFPRLCSGGGSIQNSPSVGFGRIVGMVRGVHLGQGVQSFLPFSPLLRIVGYGGGGRGTVAGTLMAGSWAQWCGCERCLRPELRGWGQLWVSTGLQRGVMPEMTAGALGGQY